MAELWSCKVSERATITGWRDPNEMIRKDMFESIRWLGHKKLVPAKDLGKSLPKLAKNQDVVIATFAATAKIKWENVDKLVDPNARAQARWFQQEVLAELGRGAKPASLGSVKLAIRQAHPDAAIDDETRFLLRMLAERSPSLRKLIPNWLEPTFEPDGKKAPELFFKHELDKTKAAKRVVATAEVIAPKIYLDELPDDFTSTAF